MQALARLMAQQIAERLHGTSPVIAVHDEVFECRTVDQGAITDDYEDIAYVLSYSESSRSICITGFGILKTVLSSQKGVALAPDMGSVYGRTFAKPLSGVPLQRHVTTFASAYLSRLHWRATFDSSVAASAVTSQDFASPGLNLSMEEFSLPFVEIRAEVARRHNTLNEVLDSLIGLTAAFLVLSFIRLALLHRAVGQILRVYDSSLSVLQFLFVDCGSLCDQARDRSFEQRQEMLARGRQEQIFRRELEEVQRRLGALASAAPNDQDRSAIMNALKRGELEEMQVLLDQLQPQSGQRSPEERLHLLLESLKEYCTKEEFEKCQNEVFQVFERFGFRRARETVIVLHDGFRSRTKELDEMQQSGQDSV